MNRRRLLVPFGIVVLILASLLVSGGSGNAATNCEDTLGNPAPCGGFKPAWGASGVDPVIFSTLATSAHPDITTKLNVDQPSMNVSESITFADSAVATGTVPVGAYVGQLTRNALEGLANSGCNNSVPTLFNFVSATVSQTNVISPANQPGNVDANFAEDDGDFDNDHQTTLTTDVAAGAGPTTLTVADSSKIGPVAGPYGEVISVGGLTAGDVQNLTVTGMTATTITVAGAIKAHTGSATTAPGDTVDIVDPGMNAFAFNGIADGADAYPSFLQTAFAPIVPVARYMGVDNVSGLVVLLNLLVFAPGDLSTLPNHAWMTAAWGTPSVAVLNDPVAAPSNGNISDFCNFNSQTLLLGVSHDNLCTPAPGPAACQEFAQEFAPPNFLLRKAVDGGTTGSTTPNEAGSIRATNPVSAQVVKWRQYAMSNRDADGDGIDNSLDPCPFNADTVWDPYAVDSVVAPGPGDTDGDGIPNTCDTVTGGFGGTIDQDSDGWVNRLDNCPQVANGVFTTTANLNQFDQDVNPVSVAVPDGGPRSDGIGPACNSQVLNGPPATGAAGNGPYGKYAATVIAQNICIGGGGANAQACSTTLDNDNDGIKNAFDNCIGGGANPLGGANGPSSHAPPAGYSQSQLDLNVDGFVDGTDNTILGSAFAKVGGVPGAPAGYEGRLDLNYDGAIDGTDNAILGNAFNTVC